MVSFDADSSQAPGRTTSRTITLAFHKLLPEFSYGSTNYSPRRFGRLLEFLSKKRYGFVNPAKESTSPDDQHLLISFDDGYQHLLDQLPPLMDRFSFTPLIFLPTGFIGASNSWDYSRLFRDDPHLDRAGIRHLAELGCRFGSHGHSHSALTRLTDKQLMEELRVSKATIENITGREVAALSYPFGRFNAHVMAAVEEAGFVEAYSMNFPELNDPSLARGRIGIYGYDTRFTINQKLSGGRLYRLERWKARFTNRLSGGTILLNRLSGRGNSTPGK